MKTTYIIATIIALSAGQAAFAEEVKNEQVTKAENGRAEARAEAKAVANMRNVSTTMVNGKAVTIIEEPDENGKMRRKLITYSPSGKPKIKDITPKEKQPAPADKKAPVTDKAAPAKKNGGEEL
ncbi:MAG: hypothetical protein RL088_2314 [Verrucomicrobiota bacterium]|jgi:hypothetical protein